MVDLVVCSAAEAGYAEALCWYAERTVSAAERFDAEFDEALQTIASDPQRFPRCDECHHYYLMRHFPFKSSIASIKTIGLSLPLHTQHGSRIIGRDDSPLPSIKARPQSGVTFGVAQRAATLVRQYHWPS